MKSILFAAALCALVSTADAAETTNAAPTPEPSPKILEEAAYQAFFQLAAKRCGEGDQNACKIIILEQARMALFYEAVNELMKAQKNERNR